MLCQPKLPGGASRCATGVLRMRLVMLREPHFAKLPHIGTRLEALPSLPRCATGRNRPLAHRGRLGRASRRVPMCGSLASVG